MQCQYVVLTLVSVSVILFVCVHDIVAAYIYYYIYRGSQIHRRTVFFTQNNPL